MKRKTHARQGAQRGTPRKHKNKKKARRKGLVPGLAAALGGAAGNWMAGPAGGALGARAGQWFGDITGLGDYTVHQNSLLMGSGGGQSTSGPPVFRGESAGRIRITHREQAYTVHSSVGFEVQKFPINPGNSGLFPWLSTMADSYQAYDIKGMVISYETNSGVAVSGSNPALGRVTLATSYDVLSEDFTDSKSMNSSQFTVTTVPAQSVLHPIECDPRCGLVLDRLFVSKGNTSDVADKRFHDHGNFYVATEGQQADGNEIGQIWVSYDIEFYLPIMPDSQVSQIDRWAVVGAARTQTPTTHAWGTDLVSRALLPGSDAGTVILPPVLEQPANLWFQHMKFTKAGTFHINLMVNWTGATSASLTTNIITHELRPTTMLLTDFIADPLPVGLVRSVQDYFPTGSASETFVVKITDEQLMGKPNEAVIAFTCLQWDTNAVINNFMSVTSLPVYTPNVLQTVRSRNLDEMLEELHLPSGHLLPQPGMQTIRRGPPNTPILNRKGVADTQSEHGYVMTA